MSGRLAIVGLLKEPGKLRALAGLLAAALWLPVLGYATGGIWGQFWFFMIALYTVPLTLFVALPLVFLLRRRLSFVVCLVAGIGTGLVGAAIFWGMTHWEAAVNWGPALIIAGALSSVVFWVVGVWNNRLLSSPVHQWPSTLPKS